MTTAIRAFAALCLVSLLASCGSDQQSGGQNAQSYKDTKTIVLDVLKTDDAQKTIQEAQSKNMDKTTKLLSTGDGQQIQLAVKDVLTAPGTDKLLQKTMTDPRFAGEFAKASQSTLKQLHKDLIKDPDYQQSMLQVMSNPEYEKMMLATMKKAAYRQQIMSVMQESLQSPLFRVQLIDMLKKVVEEETKPGGQAGQQQAGGGGGGGGGGTSTGKSSGGDGGSGGGGDGGGGDAGGGGKKDQGGDKGKKSDQGDDDKKKKGQDDQ